MRLSIKLDEWISGTSVLVVPSGSVTRVEVKSEPQGPGNHGMTIGIHAAHDLHPGLGEPFQKELDEALALGLKLLTTPYIGLSVPAVLLNRPEIYAPEVFASTDYNERFGEVVGTINARGVGEGALAVIAKEFAGRLDSPRPAGLSDRDLIHGVYRYACASDLTKEKKLIEKAFAEAADGDLVAAHVALGADYLCTEDRGRSASIFDEDNRAWLKSEHEVEILDVQRLSKLLGSHLL